jgi:hypothetical protein
MERQKKKKLIPVVLTLLALATALAIHPPVARAQAAAQRFVGTVTAIAGDTLTVKTDAGDAHQVQVPSSAVIKQLAPGQKDLSSAQTIQLSNLAVGDRVLVRLDPNATGSTPQALQIVAMKQTDIAQEQQKERDEWARNGSDGLVKSADTSTGVIVITKGVGPAMKTITVQVTKDTKLLRYAPNSVRFADAQPGPITAIQVGDQLHVLGQKNADGSTITATEVVSGGFRNISGVVAAIDAAASTLTVKDLVTKKNVTVHITPDAEMRRLPDAMARMIAAAFKGNATGTAGGAGGRPGATPGASPGGASPGAGSGQGWNGGGAGAAQGRRAGGLEQALSRAPAVQLADLQKGEAVMLVSTQGTTDVTAIKLLAGVEPLLESPEASRDLLSNWSMGSGGGGEEAQ